VSVRALRIAVVLTLSALLAGCGGQAGTGNLDSMLGEGWRAYSLGAFDAAHATFAGVSEDKRANDKQLYSAVLGLAVTAQYQTTPDLDAALKYYNQLATINVEGVGPQSMLGIGTIYISQGKVAEGQVELTRLVQQYPDAEEADEATVQLANSLFRPTPDTNADGGYALASTGFVQRGIDLLEARLKARPNNSLAAVMHMIAGSKLVDQGVYDQSVTHLRAALDLGVASSTIAASVTWQVACIADEKLHDYELAEKYYADFADKNKNNQLYYVATLRKERVEKLLAEKPKG
jgi:tetratricopeptide (TPR) repeat protein